MKICQNFLSTSIFTIWEDKSSQSTYNPGLDRPTTKDDKVMAKTLVQQSQISGSLAFNDTLASGASLAGKQSLVGDLDALRSQINKIIGGDNWYDALSGSQDLADIYAAVRVSGENATVQGNLSVNGNTTLGDASSDTITFTAKAATDLAMDSHKVSGLMQASAAGDALAWGQDASVSDLIVTAGEFTVDASGNVVSAELKITGDNANTGALYLVGASGEIAEEANLVFSAGSLDVTGDLDVSGVADLGELYVAAATGLSGTLAVDGVSDFAADVYMAADLYVSGAMEVAQGLTVTGDRLEVTGSMGVTGAVDFDSTLNVDGVADFKADVYMAAALGVSGSLTVAQAATLSNGLTVNNEAADFNADVTANKISIDSDISQRLYIVDADGSIKDEEKLTFDGSELWVDGDLEVVGGDITLSNSMSISSATAGKLVLTSDLVEVSGDIKVGGNDIKASDDTIAISLSGADVTVKGDLTVEGNEIKSTTGTVLELNGDDAYFKSDVHVAGKLFVDQDFVVKGTLTQIDTTNLRVEDAFIYLATGSLGTTDSGIVLHGGAGAGMDLVMGQDGGAGEFIFGRGNRAPDGDGAMDGIELVPAWMSGLKVGDHEGSLSGSFEAVADGAKLEAAADLLLAANSQTPISFIESGEYEAFNAQFPGSSLVAAIVAAGGNFKQDAFLPGVKEAGALIDFEAALGFELRSTAIASSAAKKLAMDVYLNGVRLAYGDDYEIESVSQISLEMSTMADDRLLVVVHNAAA